MMIMMQVLLTIIVRDYLIQAQRRIRYSVIDFSNPSPEVIWADTRKEEYYDIQNRSIPRQYIDIVYDGSGGIAPTLQMVESFYTNEWIANG